MTCEPVSGTPRLTTSSEEALVLQSQIAKIEHPRSTVLSSFRNYLNGKEGPVLGGRAKYLLDDPHDLIGLRTPVAKDALSRFLQDHWPGGSQTPNSTVKIFPEQSVSLVVGTISIVIAAMLLIGAMSSLHYVKSFQARLGTISGFTVAFALSVGLLTNARTGEIYAATAAYAAVLVVFVSGDLG